MPRAADSESHRLRSARAAIAQLLRFGAVGLTCLVLSTAVLAALHSLAGVNYLLAYAASFIVGNVLGYLLNARFTFSVRSVSHTGAARYMLVNATLLGVNTLALDFLVHRMHMWYLAAAVLLGVLTAPISFLAQRFVTYRLSLRRGIQNI
jgi:putative flippase GtrA